MTKNLIESYQHICGLSKIPLPYQYWACMSLISACVGNRIWYEKYRGDKMYTNLYIFLIGPSGCGKGAAIKQVSYLAHGIDEDLIPRYKGEFTKASLVDILGKDGEDPETGIIHIPSPVLWLITDELAADVGKGRDADAIVKFMTKLYTAGPVEDTSTRWKGRVTIYDPCVTWVACTTPEWFIDALTGDAIRSGLGRRLCCVFGDFTNRRYHRPILPTDYEKVRKGLLVKLTKLCLLPEQEITFDPKAIDYEKQWCYNRPEILNKELRPHWESQPDLVTKISMLMALADFPPLIVREKHIRKAVALTTWNLGEAEKALVLANRTGVIRTEDMIKEMIQEKGKMTKTELGKKCYARGVDVRTRGRIIDDLVKDENVVLDRNDKGAVVYLWIGED